MAAIKINKQSPTDFPFTLVTLYFLVARCGNLVHQLQLPLVTPAGNLALILFGKVLVTPYHINEVTDIGLSPISLLHSRCQLSLFFLHTVPSFKPTSMTNLIVFYPERHPTRRHVYSSGYQLGKALTKSGDGFKLLVRCS